ncbi:MAG: hypothetical protein AAGI07_00270 [Bacteroidota bacterium]
MGGRKQLSNQKMEIPDYRVPDQFVLAGISTVGSLLGMAFSKGTKYESTGSIWGGLAGTIIGYYLVKK